MVFSSSGLGAQGQQPSYTYHSDTTEEEEENGSLLQMAGFGGAFLLSLPTRVVFERLIVKVGPDHLHRGFGATLTGGVHDLVGGFQQLWREDHARMFVRWPLLGVAVGAFAFTCQELSLGMSHTLLKVTPEEEKARSPKWYLSKFLSLSAAGVLLYPMTPIWSFYCNNIMPSWKFYLGELVLKGNNYFYTALPLNTLNSVASFLNDVIRTKLLHWHKKTFFPDLIPVKHQIDYDEFDDEPVPLSGLLGGPYRPLMFSISHYMIYLLICAWSALSTGAIDTVLARMLTHPTLYGPLGITGTCRAIFREEGCWGFYKGFLPNFLFTTATFCAGIDEEANTGLPP